MGSEQSQKLIVFFFFVVVILPLFSTNFAKWHYVIGGNPSEILSKYFWNQNKHYTMQKKNDNK